jgi:hypothetical protein
MSVLFGRDQTQHGTRAETHMKGVGVNERHAQCWKA